VFLTLTCVGNPDPRTNLHNCKLISVYDSSDLLKRERRKVKIFLKLESLDPISGTDYPNPH
jgi:hypothetical protein